jgi:dihydrodipicolinate synthase/N-acetylneuraminate lyase
MHGVAAYKEVLYRRGIFATTRSRAPGAVLDADDRRELDAILEDVGALFTIRD